MSICEQIYSDPRHNDRQFAAMMAQGLKEQIMESNKSSNGKGRPRLYRSIEEIRERDRIAEAKLRAKKKSRASVGAGERQ